MRARHKLRKIKKKNIFEQILILKNCFQHNFKDWKILWLPTLFQVLNKQLTPSFNLSEHQEMCTSGKGNFRQKNVLVIRKLS